MRVYRGGLSVPVSIVIYPRVLSPCPHKCECIGVVWSVPVPMCMLIEYCPRVPMSLKIEVSMGGIVYYAAQTLHVRRLIMLVFPTNEMSKINATVKIRRLKL